MKQYTKEDILETCKLLVLTVKNDESLELMLDVLYTELKYYRQQKAQSN